MFDCQSSAAHCQRCNQEKDEETEIKQAEKKLETAKTFNNNDMLTAKKTLTLARALSRDQLLKLVSDLAAEDPGRY